jgi:hypothetical protein
MMKVRKIRLELKIKLRPKVKLETKNKACDGKKSLRQYQQPAVNDENAEYKACLLPAIVVMTKIQKIKLVYYQLPW